MEDSIIFSMQTDFAWCRHLDWLPSETPWDVYYSYCWGHLSGDIETVTVMRVGSETEVVISHLAPGLVSFWCVLGNELCKAQDGSWLLNAFFPFLSSCLLIFLSFPAYFFLKLLFFPLLCFHPFLFVRSFFLYFLHSCFVFFFLSFFLPFILSFFLFFF